MDKDPFECYKQLHDKRSQKDNGRQQEKLKIRDNLKPEHQDFINKAETIKLIVRETNGEKLEEE